MGSCVRVCMVLVYESGCFTLCLLEKKVDSEIFKCCMNGSELVGHR